METGLAGMESSGALVPEQRAESAVPDHAALDDGREDGHLVVEGLAEAAAVVQVHGEGVVAEQAERLVVVPVHVAHEEVEHGHVHEVEQAPPRVVGRDVLHQRAVVRVCEPSRVAAQSPMPALHFTKQS